MGDDFNLNCRMGGNDVVVALHPSTPGGYSVRVTVPTGVTVYLGTDGFARACSEEWVGRRCITSGSATTRSDTGGLSVGDIFYYIGTSVPSTVVIDTELP